MLLTRRSVVETTTPDKIRFYRALLGLLRFSSVRLLIP